MKKPVIHFKPDAKFFRVWEDIYGKLHVVGRHEAIHDPKLNSTFKRYLTNWRKYVD
jgi:hypothetical protein